MDKKNIVAAKKANETRKSLMLVSGPFNAKQLLQILQKTPKEHIYKRPGKGGGEWEYVTGVYVKKCLNYIFGWMWDFEIKEHGREKSEDGELVWVLGKLTIHDRHGKVAIIKEQFGRADVKLKRNTKIPLDFGNDLKAASTDALKKCAAELGIASDIYGRNEFREIQKQDKAYIPPEKVEEGPQGAPAASGSVKLTELKGMLKGDTDEKKLAGLKRRTGLSLDSFKITERHAGILIASLLNSETK